MLHAIAQNKPGTTARLVAAGAGIGTEDLITSSIMGPLDFITAGASWNFWKIILRLVRNTTPLPEGCPNTVEVALWPHRIKGGISCEPDAVLTYFWESGEKRILVFEFKWRSKLSRQRSSQPTQLHAQWNNYLDGHERAEALHFYIAHETSEGIRALKEKDDWNGRLVLLPWNSFHSALSSLTKISNGPAFRWAELAHSFLSKLNVHGFSGFVQILQEVNVLAEWLSHDALLNTLFYQDSIGISRISLPDEFPSQHQSIFFSENPK